MIHRGNGKIFRRRRRKRSRLKAKVKNTVHTQKIKKIKKPELILARSCAFLSYLRRHHTKRPEMHLSTNSSFSLIFYLFKKIVLFVFQPKTLSWIKRSKRTKKPKKIIKIILKPVIIRIILRISSIKWQKKLRNIIKR